MSKKLEASKEWFRRVWAEEDSAAIDEMFVPDVPNAARGLGSEALPGPKEFKGFHQVLLRLLKDVYIEIKNSAENEDWIAIHAVLTAKCRKSGKPIEMDCQTWVRITEGKLREAHNQLDFIGLFEQLELMPSGSMERCLGGECLIEAT